ncbi:hypothetical protein [Streptomyces fulvorobeus]|uniref:Secreted protein n=1 Tax=Streptomyces fulvorobeus TaxID=284028 RepID=A0A7J0C5A4_9ACTN|nr:hypothetical protein [Streptomyces fulvorobeus]NYE41219.1 hypothetical protein [Streptomyces fulvorobeus]GFM97558.1 hypothetical protein Sfulv_23690 [Streptomyces fulvorobeus]
MSATPASPLSRRGFLLRATAVATAVALPHSQALASPAYAAGPQDYTFPKAVREGVARAEARNERLLAGTRSANGWDMETATDQGGSIANRPVPGTPVTDLRVRLGAPETVLVHLVRRFHYELAELQPGEVVGWSAPDGLRGPARNLASGTAVRIRPGHCPPGTKGGYFPLELAVLRDILAELDGVVRWGGDDRAVDEALFYLAVGPDNTRLTAVAERLRAGEGAGTLVDVHDKRRRSAADALARRQRNDS